MSSRDPLWFCHQCHSEMRPLMVPEPVCASCHGSFVEKMENPSDDPREFAHPDPTDIGPDALPPGIDAFLLTLQGLMDRGAAQPPRQRPENTNSTSPRLTFQISGPGGARIMSLGGPNTLRSQTAGAHPPGSRSPSTQEAIPTMSDFIRPDFPDRGGPTITGPLMAQYLMAFLGHQNPLAAMMAGDLPENGRLGDYVFNQEALDQIVTQLMENSNAHRPVPATDEIMNNLPRETLTQNSKTLEKDCAVCKEQFNLNTEDPDEQMVITLPCQHPFHQPCILPWLKTSGTCPVCRYALIPQPEEHHRTASPGQDSTRPNNTSRSRSPRPDRSPDHGIFHTIFSGLTGGHHNGPPDRNRNGDTGVRRSSPNSPRVPQNQSDNSGSHVPGSWNEDLD